MDVVGKKEKKRNEKEKESDVSFKTLKKLDLDIN